MLSSEIQSIAFERTLPQLQEMIELGGMKIKKVHATRLESFFFSSKFMFNSFSRGWASITEVVPA